MDPRMDKNERLVTEILAEHRGKGKAITYSRIAAMLNLDERRIRKIVHRLIEDFRMPICSSYDADCPGYYMAETQEQVDETYRKLRGHGLSILRRAANVKNITLADLVQQLSLEI